MSMSTERWQVATWRRDNVGGTDLILNTDGKTFVNFATGPTPWGSGSWGPFPIDVVSEVRPLRADDSWPVSGCPSRRWTAGDLLRAMKDSSTITCGMSTLAKELEQAIAVAEAA